jgi:hypothetical protein
MTHYNDLTDYEYFSNTDNAVNVGWLSKDQEYATGETPQAALDKIIELTKKPVNLCRGFHECEFCQEQSTPTLYGNGEIRVTDPDTGKTYASPMMILHYILNHDYRPPEEFIQTLIKLSQGNE